MSAQEQRQTIIYDNIPNLIKSLTGFSEDEENFNLCLEFAESKIATHRFLSVNSHEVRRRIDGLAERFMASNYTNYANRFKDLCQSFITEPLCIDHYETDVQWSVLQFLLEMSKNPVSALAENKNQIQLCDLEEDEEAERRNERERHMADMIHSLVLVNEPVARAKYDDSDLSEWSDDEDDDAIQPLATQLSVANVVAASDLSIPVNRPVTIVTELKPPQKPSHYTEYDDSSAMEWLKSNVQHSWWLDASYKTPITSAFPSAHFNKIYGEFLEKESFGLTQADNVSIISEWCLLREILWMFLYNDNNGEKIDSNYGFKFFTLDLATQEVRVNENVSLASATTQGSCAMVAKFVPFMTYSYRLRTFVQRTLNYDFSEGDIEPPQTIQCYAIGLKHFLHAFAKVICQKEAEIIKQDPFEVHSIIRLFVELQPQFTILEHLFEIHESCYLDYRLYPAHIATMYLLAKLKFKLENAFMPTYLNKVGALFFTATQHYYHILRNLWNTGRLDDWLHEFLIEKMANSDVPADHTQNSYCARSYDLQVITSKVPNKNVNRSPSPHVILDTIDSCQFLRMLTDSSLEGASVIDIVCNLNKLPNMLSMLYQNNINKCLRTELVEKCLTELREWHIANSDDHEIDADVPHNLSNDSEGTNSSHGKDAILNPVEFLGDENPLLFMVFEEVFKRSNLIPGEIAPDENQEAIKPLPSTSYQFYCAFNEITQFYLPVMLVMKKYTQEVLETRINIANQYILDIYLNEFDIMNHMSNLRMVFFLGAGDLMLTFYSNLFKRMNAGENWSNPYLLTVQLDGILCMQYPKMASLFSIQLKSDNWQTKLPLEAIKDITLVYNVQDSVRDVIQQGNLQKYNTVFQFLMQVKWAIWTLETQRFPVMFKKRRPFRPMNIFDLIFKRLALVRNWIIYSVQSVHSHLMTLVIQSMGQQLPKKLKKSKSLRELMEIHGFYIDTIHDYCFQTAKDENLRTAIEQLLSLVAVVHDEWKNLMTLDEDRLDVVDHDDSSVNSADPFDIPAAVRNVDDIENAFISCHLAIADILSQEVFIRDRDDLAALSAAFTCSCPC